MCCDRKVIDDRVGWWVTTLKFIIFQYSSWIFPNVPMIKICHILINVTLVYQLTVPFNAVECLRNNLFPVITIKQSLPYNISFFPYVLKLIRQNKTRFVMAPRNWKIKFLCLEDFPGAENLLTATKCWHSSHLS